MRTSVNSLKHPKEKTYLTILIVVSIICWIPLIPLAVAGFFVSIPLIIISWLSALYFQAVVLGSSVRVSSNQYPELHARASELCEELGVSKMPTIFIVNSSGLVNAMAYTTLSKRYVFLYSSLVDLLLLKEHRKELDFILAHEIGHHAAGHVSLWKNLLVLPGKIIPFLGAAYGRACELTADRIGHHMTKKVEHSERALAALALGSSALVDSLNIDEFKRQEHDIPALMGFIHKLFSTHPRTTKRVLEIQQFSSHSTNLQTGSSMHAPHRANGGNKGRFCSKCGARNNSTDRFCANCGNTLN